MLKSIMIQNFAIIDQVQIEFDNGMSVLTGETGAGKSIIIDAISLLMGARATSFMVKSGAKKAFIEGVFEVKETAMKERLSELGFDIDEDLVISREISAEGKSQARLNYRIVSLTVLKEISQYLADIHSQFETQYLLNDKIHLHLLDQYIGQPMAAMKQQYSHLYQDYQAAKKAYDTLLAAPSDEEQLDFYQAKIQEIDDADLHEGDIEALEQEKKRMSQFEKINEKLKYVLAYLQADRGALDQLYQAEHQFSQIDDEALEPLQDRLSDAYYQLNDLVDEISSYQDQMTFDEYRYEEIQNKLFAIRKLQRQYGYEVSEILAKKAEYEEKINLIENKEVMLDKLFKKKERCYEQCLQQAQQMHALRYQEAKKLEQSIMTELKDLYMSNTHFICHFETSKTLLNDGIDEMCFMISTNVGQSLHRLSDIASGGELSRLMLGMKCIFTRLEGVQTVIFDEVDTGVSGKVASAIGRKMKEIARSVQVICITHLPQVASFADHHLYVYKQTAQDRTLTGLAWLNEEQRIQEIAKMLSNDTINQSALDNARYLINENGKF